MIADWVPKKSHIHIKGNWETIRKSMVQNNWAVKVSKLVSDCSMNDSAASFSKKKEMDCEGILDSEILKSQMTDTKRQVRNRDIYVAVMA